VKAHELDHISNIVGQVAGGAIGIGAAIGIMNIADNVTASAGGTLSAGGTIKVDAILGSDVKILTFDGAAGGVALGAAVAVVSDSSATQASLADGAQVIKASSLSINADATRTFDLSTDKVAVGAAAAGVTFTKLTVTGNISATIGNDVQIGQNALSTVGDVTVMSRATVHAVMNTTIFDVTVGGNLDASFALIDLTPDVIASIGDNTDITSTGAVKVKAEGTEMSADTEVDGTAVTLGLTFNGTFALPTVGGTTRASIGSNGSVESVGLTVDAKDLKNVATANLTTVAAGTIAASGALATANVTRSTTASIGGNASILNGGHIVEVDATSTNTATSTAQGAALGAASVSILVSLANVSGATRASVGAGSSVAGTLNVKAKDTSHGTPDDQGAGRRRFHRGWHERQCCD